MTIQERDSAVPVGYFVPLHGDVNRLAFFEQSSAIDECHNSFPDRRAVLVQAAQQLSDLLRKFLQLANAAVHVELTQVMWLDSKR